MKTKFRLRWRYLLLFAIIVALSFVLESAARPVIRSVAKYQASIKAAEIINSTIVSELETSGDIIKNAIKINYSEDGKVKAIVSDSYVFSFIKEHISKSLIAAFSEAKNYKTDIPLGVFSGISIFSGTGPGVPVQISLIGTPESEIQGELISTGINQNIYRVTLEYRINITALIPFYSVEVEIADEIVLAEIVFTGDIPEVVINK